MGSTGGRLIFARRLPVKQLMLRVIVFTALAQGVLFAQDMTGTWQGTLQAGKDLRTVIKISKTDGGGLKAVMYSIDQGGQPIAAAITLQSSTVKMSVAGIGGMYEGRLN